MPRKAFSRPKNSSKHAISKEDTLGKKGPRKLRQPRYTSFHLQHRIPKTQPTIPGAFRLLVRAIKLLGSHWKLFGGIILIYLVLNVMFVQGSNLIGSGDTLNTTKSVLNGVYNGPGGAISVGGALFLYLLGGGSSNTSTTADGYQFVMILLISLVLIWSLRQAYAKSYVRIRDGFYNGMTPLIPFIMVLLVIGLELVPGILGFMLYSTVSGNGIAATVVEKVLWAVITSLLFLLTCYLMTSSIFALYVVTLPDMTPLKALRSARQLVLYRRWTVMRKVLFVPVILIVLAAIIMIPFILLITKLAPIMFFILSAIVVAVVHSYMYGLYRELLNER